MQEQMVSYTTKGDDLGVRFFQFKSDSLPAWAENIRDEPFECVPAYLHVCMQDDESVEYLDGEDEGL
jgi:hypothetical protein